MAVLRRSAATSHITSILPGITACAVLGSSGFLLTNQFSLPIGSATIALLLGLMAGNLFSLPKLFDPGLHLASRRLLRIGIVLLGARLTVDAIVELGLSVMVWIILGLVVVAALMIASQRVTRIPAALTCLIGVGVGVCGNSAILAVAPLISATNRHVSYSVASVTLFGTLAVFAYPLIGHALGLGDDAFGVWAGLGISDTSQVVAAAFGYSERAGDVATVVKLTRNVFIAPITIGIGAAMVVVAARQPTDSWRPAASWHQAVPLFVLGFLAMSLAASAGLISEEVGRGMGTLSALSIAVALAAVGASTRVRDILSTGLAPLITGGIAALSLAVVALLIALTDVAGGLP